MRCSHIGGGRGGGRAQSNIGAEFKGLRGQGWKAGVGIGLLPVPTGPAGGCTIGRHVSWTCSADGQTSHFAIMP